MAFYARIVIVVLVFSPLFDRDALSRACISQKGGKRMEEEKRKSEYPIEPLLLKRASSYDLHRTLSESDMRKKLNQLFAAFIWAPSSFNAQPGRLVYALYGTEPWNQLFGLLVPFNKEWVKNAGALVLVLSRKNFEYNEKPNKTHSFDAGAATQNLQLQATALGLVAHALEGFDYAKARKIAKVPKGYVVEAMVAIGERASAEHSTKEFAQKDAKKAQRKKISEFAFEGTFG